MMDIIPVMPSGGKRRLPQIALNLTLRFVITGLSLVLNILLFLVVLGVFSIETTAFAALLAAVGVAIGVAVSGLLAHVTAGLFMLLLRPFKVGDFVAGGVTGTIESFSANSYRRVLLPVQLANSADHRQAIALLEDLGQKIPNVVVDPAPSASICEFKPAGPVVTLAGYCATDDYWQVFYDGNRRIREASTEAAFPAPMEQLQVLSAV